MQRLIGPFILGLSYVLFVSGCGDAATSVTPNTESQDTWLGNDAAAGTDTAVSTDTGIVSSDITPNDADVQTSNDIWSDGIGENDSDSPDSAGSEVEDSTDVPDVTDDTPGGLNRKADPVVILGAQLPSLQSAEASDIVAFARQQNAWVQVPVQVDERVVQDFCEIYGKSSGLWTTSPACKTSLTVTALFYADPSTFTGPDTDSKLDNDDEIVLMARDAGDRITSWEMPTDVIAGSGVELELIDGSDTAYVYLFERDGETLKPGAGANYVTYDFTLQNGVNYATDYDLYGYGCGGSSAICDPSMMEDTTVEGAAYVRHFSARWVTDELRLTAGDSTGVDILDIHQNRFGPGSCGRHVLTYSTAEGAYIVNKSGPVRALRAYLGANSGPLTQRTHRFYDQREDIVTHLRVHALSLGVMDVFDYSAAAIGMVYYNDLNPEGLTIDGVPDAANESGLHQWEFVTGPQGSLVMTGLLDTSLELDFAHFYWADEQEPSFDQCDTSTIIDAPDSNAFGTSGAWLDGPLPDTDPKNGASDHIMVTRMIYYEKPSLSQSEALSLVAGAQTPVQVFARLIDSAGTGAVCGDGQCDTDEGEDCPLDCLPVDGSCGDGLCLPPENSVSCLADCPAGTGGAVICGDGVCDGSVENKLSCAEDCWVPYSNVVNCAAANCEGLLDACADESGCVALVACVGPCVAGGNGAFACVGSCSDSLMTSQFDVQAAQQLLLCVSTNSCF